MNNNNGYRSNFTEPKKKCENFCCSEFELPDDQYYQCYECDKIICKYCIEGTISSEEDDLEIEMVCKECYSIYVSKNVDGLKKW